MSKKNDMRHAIQIVWLITFIGMWIIFNVRLPKNVIHVQLDKIEESISKGDWNKARISMNVLQKIYNKNKLLIQANNATEILLTFDHTLGQLDAAIQYEKDSALEYVGGLQASLDYE